MCDNISNLLCLHLFDLFRTFLLADRGEMFPREFLDIQYWFSSRMYFRSYHSLCSDFSSIADRLTSIFIFPLENGTLSGSALEKSA